jgi:endonuclease III
MTKTTNPTADEVAGLQAEVKVAERVSSNARGSKEEEAAGQRVTAAYKAILSARPTDPSVMAAQLRFLVAESVVDAAARGALEHIAEQLEAMSGGIVLSADAAAQIRAALLAVLEHTGGGVEAADDPNLSPGIGLYSQESERQLRAAYELLNVATPPAGGTTV